MNEETAKLIGEMADKLGTTAEYLFGVLVRQAYVEAVTSSVMCVALIAGLFFWTRFLIGKTKEKKDADGRRVSYAEWQEEAAAVPWIATIIAFVFVLVMTVCTISSVPTMLINPEYWAIKQIIGR